MECSVGVFGLKVFAPVTALLGLNSFGMIWAKCTCRMRDYYDYTSSQLGGQEVGTVKISLWCQLLDQK